MKQLLGRLATSSERQVDIGLLVLRLWFGLVMAFAHGLPKLENPDKITGFLTMLELPAPSVMAWLAIAAELVGGILLALGLLTRVAAFGLIVTMLVAAFVAHADDPFQKMEFALAYGVAGLALLITGPGRLSLDHKLFGRGSAA